MQHVYIHVSCRLRAGEMAQGLGGRDEWEIAGQDSLQGWISGLNQFYPVMQDENSGKSHMRVEQHMG